jgi:hypothetical protein
MVTTTDTSHGFDFQLRAVIEDVIMKGRHYFEALRRGVGFHFAPAMDKTSTLN